VTRELLDILNHEGLATLPRRATHALAIFNTATSQWALKWAKHKLIAHNAVEASPQRLNRCVYHSRDIGHVGNIIRLTLSKSYDLPMQQVVTLIFATMGNL
jgi:hypothetical protein